MKKLTLISTVLFAVLILSSCGRKETAKELCPLCEQKQDSLKNTIPASNCVTDTIANIDSNTVNLSFTYNTVTYPVRITTYNADSTFLTTCDGVKQLPVSRHGFWVKCDTTGFTHGGTTTTTTNDSIFLNSGNILVPNPLAGNLVVGNTYYAITNAPGGSGPEAVQCTVVSVIITGTFTDNHQKTYYRAVSGGGLPTKTCYIPSHYSNGDGVKNLINGSFDNSGYSFVVVLF